MLHRLQDFGADSSKYQAQIEKEGADALFKMTENGDALYKFCRSRIESKTKSGQMPPVHELFDRCEDLKVFYDEFEKKFVNTFLCFTIPIKKACFAGCDATPPICSKIAVTFEAMMQF